MTIALPTQPQTRAELGITPMSARILLLSVPKIGKSTLAGAWAPKKTLFIDTQHGTDMLDGEHFVIHVAAWPEFVEAVALVTKGGHDFETVIIDVVDDVWKMADAFVAKKGGTVAAGLMDFGRGTAETEGLFRREIGALLATTLGLWFVGHADLLDVNKVQKYVPVLDKRVRNYVTGACQFILYAERTGTKRILHTQPSERFEAGSRVPLPEPLEMNAQKLYAAINAGLKATAPKTEPKPFRGNGDKRAAEAKPEPEEVTA